MGRGLRERERLFGLAQRRERAPFGGRVHCEAQCPAGAVVDPRLQERPVEAAAEKTVERHDLARDGPAMRRNRGMRLVARFEDIEKRSPQNRQRSAAHVGHAEHRTDDQFAVDRPHHGGHRLYDEREEGVAVF